MSEITDLIEEIRSLQNQLSAMNKYYAQAVTKTLITKEELQELKDIMKLIKEEPVTSKKIKQIKNKTNEVKTKNGRRKK